MNPQFADAIFPLIALFGVGTFSLIGLRMYFAHRARHLELKDRDQAPQVAALVDDLRQEVQALRDDIGELHERVDFAERLLARGKE